MDVVDRLLRGPRGRDLLFSCALRAEEAEQARRGADHPGPLTWAEFRLERPGTAIHAEVLEALATVPVTSPSPDEMPELLACAVNNGRYWQEPELRDDVLEHPDAADLLRPWAQQLAEIAPTWWGAAVDLDDQWIVRAPYADPVVMTDVRRRLQEAHRDEVAKQREWVGILRRRRGREVSGEWWSTPWVGLASTRRWPGGRPSEDDPGVRVHDPVGAWLVEDSGFDPEEAVVRELDVPAGARVLEIASEQDWVDLCRAHPFDVTPSRQNDWRRCTGRSGRWVVPDWSAVADEWDAVHLPLLSWLDLAGRPLAVDDGTATLLAGWSPDETWWLVDLD